MASLEKEQTFLRQLTKKNITELPFNLFPPLCPFSLKPKNLHTDSPIQLVALAPKIEGNWIIRPVIYKFTTDGMTYVDAFSTEGIPDIPLYQGLPQGGTPIRPYFIIGYVQGMSLDLKTEIMETLHAQRKNGDCPEIIGVNVWYHAKVQLKFEYSKDFYSCLREIENPIWEKGNR